MRKIPETFCIKINYGEGFNYLQLDPDYKAVPVDRTSTQLIRFSTVKAARQFLKKNKIQKYDHRVIPFSTVFDLDFHVPWASYAIEIKKEKELLGYIHNDATNCKYVCINTKRGRCVWYDLKEAKKFANSFNEILQEDLKMKIVEIKYTTDNNDSIQNDEKKTVFQKFKEFVTV